MAVGFEEEFGAYLHLVAVVETGEGCSSDGGWGGRLGSLGLERGDDEGQGQEWSAEGWGRHGCSPLYSELGRFPPPSPTVLRKVFETNDISPDLGWREMPKSRYSRDFSCKVFIPCGLPI